MSRTPSILVINPNSSQSITELLSKTVESPPGVYVHFETGPKHSPPAINDDETALQSCDACLSIFTPSYLEQYDGYLVACYSDHPLVPALKKLVPDKPVLGILEASAARALLIGDKFGVVTTGPAWEPLLTKAITTFLGYPSELYPLQNPRFAGVASTGLGVLELHDASADVVFEKFEVAAQRLFLNGADVICLGCAGMVGMEDAVRRGVEAVGGKVKIVDGVAAGVEELGLILRKAR